MTGMNLFSEKISNRLWKIFHSRHSFKWRDFSGETAPHPNDSEMNDLEKTFWHNTNRAIDKWHHYFKIYDKFLSSKRNIPLRVLEIGVQSGGSMRMWRDYLGQEAILFGIDIDPRCALFDGEYGMVRIGSQDDPAFLQRVVEEMGGIDVVIDDGSHHSRHLRVSFETLFPLLSDGGYYIAEDLHCCYWPDWKGGYMRSSSFIEYAKTLIDDMHHWYHGQGQKRIAARDILSALHFYDSMIIFEKHKTLKPICSSRGSNRL
jgi:hypothetical protein|tara:strand:- start:200 stop:979 length:780 start_codon:yes stop_codon:yes gene_type:complete